ncbi:hypothetical protein GCM10008018_49540 [Paenibacillus marchantiophytorum]|uniref:Uncharacterized protein n=1 Tax=Paenibacillus marchantiophytorum TaxID=1619310 RepID=A0ABQ1F321_9BACL|nr:hypothetical protein [Paenibacillus marchantiophytorum]GFZ97279.1 hypothetical protein GCM10008018_49540 [Paenibacillus marchantiophytorum]
MDWRLVVLIPTFTAFSMLLLGLTLFRISLSKKWPLVLLAAFILANVFSLPVFLTYTEALNPMLIILSQAILIQVIFRLKILHALMVVFLGALGYTIYLAIVLLIIWSLTNIPLADYFERLDSSYFYFKIVAALLADFTAYVLVKRRMGFTVRVELKPTQYERSRKNMLLLVLVFTFLLFSSTYYAVNLEFTYIFYFVAGFCLLLGWIIYLLYRKEMEDI